MIALLPELIAEYDLKINGVIHVGGNVGEEGPIYEGLNIKNMMFFEPLAESAKKIKHGTVHNCALGSRPGKKRIWISMPNPMSSTLLRPLGHLQHYPHIQFHEGPEVEVRTLDSFTPGPEYNFLNMDAQGYELHVLRGAVNTLPQIDYIYTEVNAEELYTGCAKIWDIDKHLHEFERVDVWWTERGWGDALYIRK